MKILRLLLSVIVATYMTTAGNMVLAQETNTSPLSITLAPLQYANVKGNIGKFEALNWMPNGGVIGVSDVTFVKDINKDISLNVEGSGYSNEDGTGRLTLKNGDLAFLKIDYKVFRKYFDNTGGVFFDAVGTPTATAWPARFSGIKANSPDLQLDISLFKLEAGLGPITDPFVDLLYEHNSKDGAKSLLRWVPTYSTKLNNGSNSAVYRKIAPAWESVDDTSDIVTLKEKKEIFGITVKGEQKAEVDYNHNNIYMQYFSDNTSSVSAAQYSQLSSQNEYLAAKLFGTGVRLEKWMFHDNAFAALGYHYNHTREGEEMQNVAQTVTSGVIQPVSLFTGQANQSLWNYSHASQNEHVITANLNTHVMPDLAFLADAKYENIGSAGNSTYYAQPTSGAYPANPSAVNAMGMSDDQNNTGEHVALRFSGIPHTSLYAEGEFEQNKNLYYESYTNLFSSGTGSDIYLNRLNRTQKQSWTVGGRIVPNRFFTFSSELKQHWVDHKYDTVSVYGNPTNQIFLSQLKVNGIDSTSTLTWKPLRWLQNSLRYQFYNTVYMPREAAEGSAVGQYPLSKNRMLTSSFTYDITVEPIDPVLLMISYSHVQSYVKSIMAQQGASSIPTFNSGNNSWLFSGSYSPLENLTWTSTVCYTIADNYVDYTTGLPLGSNFRQLNFTTGLDWTFHKWLKIGPKYEHASYRDNSLAGAGNYSANIFMLDVNFKW